MRGRALLLLVALLGAWLAYENVHSSLAADERAQPTDHPLGRAALPRASAPPAVLPRVHGAGDWPRVTSAAASTAMPQPNSCNHLRCAARFGVEEPSWAKLSFQPRIDWAAGGVRGDCVAGELEYILPKYCSPDPSWHERRGKGRWPSEERLRKIDVHAESLPQATLAEIVTLLPNRTLLLMGDSVMEQFYNTLQVIGRGAPIEEFRNDLAIVVVAQCFLQKESLEVPNSKEFLSFVSQTAPLWRMGKRKKPPKLPQQARGGMRMLYARVTTMQPDEVEAAIGTADVVVINWGLHYQRMNEYQLDLQHAFAVFEKYASRPGKAVIFQETGAQHFKASDPRGFATGEWEMRDKSTDGQCTCKPVEDFNVNVRNQVLLRVLANGTYPHVRILPFYSLTRPRWRWHFGNCTHRPNGWNYETCCDCTHFCFSPSMWHAHLYNLKQALMQSSVVAH